MQKTVTLDNVASTIDYLWGYQYKDGVLQFFPTAEGYVSDVLDEGADHFNYVYNYTDHLGNIRLSYSKSETGALKIMEENNYYPFGLKHENYNVQKYTYTTFGDVRVGPRTIVLEAVERMGYQYKYNGKELQDELGLNLYDYGARNYDPALGRWMNIDPKAETSRRWSTYSYCYDNPLRFIDPDGMQADDIILSKNLSPQQQQQALGTLQNLTNDKLVLDSSTGKVTIGATGTENSTKNLSSGTGLISNLINSSKTVTIDIGTSGSSETDVNPSNAINGIGSDANVNMDYSQQGNVLTKDLTTGVVSNTATSSEVILGHELVHAQRSMSGNAVYYSKKENFNYTDSSGAAATQNVPTEELNTVGLKGGGTYTENNLRKEQSNNERVSY